MRTVPINSAEAVFDERLGEIIHWGYRRGRPITDWCCGCARLRAR